MRSKQTKSETAKQKSKNKLSWNFKNFAKDLILAFANVFCQKKSRNANSRDEFNKGRFIRPPR